MQFLNKYLNIFSKNILGQKTTDDGETCDNSVHAHLDITYMGEEDKEDKVSENLKGLFT